MKEVFVNKHSIEVSLQERGGKGCSVKVNPIVTQGTKIAEITVDDKKSEIYSPEQKESTNVQVNPIVKQGTKIAEITVDDKKSEIYSPSVGSIATRNMWIGTQEQYDSIEEKDANTLYFITK